MHPDIEQVGPGDCPICGMALEPKGVPTGDEGPNLKLIDFRRRFWFGATLAVPLMVLAMGLPVRDWIGERLVSRCLIPGFDGAISSSEWKDALWARYCTEAPRRRGSSD
jgi:hypothetical protein